MIPRPILAAAMMLVQAVSGLPPVSLEAAKPGLAHPEANPFDPGRDAMADVDAGLKLAKASGRKLIVIFGGNWCHDSRALAGWLATERFQAMLFPRYHVVYVDVGRPQMGMGRNLDVAARFGITSIKGTPNMVIADGDGNRLNSLKDAASWRNAASRKEARIFRYFTAFGQQGGGKIERTVAD